MKKVMIILVLLNSVNLIAASKKPALTKKTENYLTISSVEVIDDTQKYQRNFDDIKHRYQSSRIMSAPMSTSLAMPSFSKSASGIETLDVADMALDKIINLGQKVWTVVEKGQPRMSYQNTVASALPENAKSWNDLENWKEPQTKVLSVAYKNFYGVEVVRFTYRIILVAGGDVNGVGSYIGYAAVEPIKMTTAYLYTFNAEAAVMNISNKGTHANPLAGMVLTVRWNVSTLVKKTLGSHTFFLDGTGRIDNAEIAELQ
ncbi:MAG: hypothetical protein WA160_14110 [Pseudobdellovibrio sp.]